MDVGGWLRGLGLGKYEAAFRDNGIDESVLPHLTVEDLKELGVAGVGDRRKLLTAIGALSPPTPSEQGASPRPSPAPPKKVSAVSAERRPITVMFCDLVGSTSLAARLDAEDWRNLVNAYLDEASASVTGLGGHVLKRLGDGLMALFGYPHAQENDAERAVRAALAIQRALGDMNARNAGKGAPQLSARIGLDSSPVVVDATGEVFGEAPNIAARVQGVAEPGTVLVTANVQRPTAGLFVAEDKGAHELKGVAAPVMLYRIVRASGGRRTGARTLTPLVGREEELALLTRRWERARNGVGQLTLIVGEPGIGKSRLVEEFRATLGETPHTFVEWSSSQLLQNTPLHPIAEWGRQRFGGAETPADRRLADLENTLQLIGLDPAEYAPLLAPLVEIPLPEPRAAKFPPEELRRRQLAALTTWVLAGARSQAIAVAFEDLHWADPTSLDLMQALAERGAQAPLFILATARPEFRPPWSLRSHHSVISLSPLDRADVARMVGELAARHALSREVVEGVSERTGGVPLFVEEVTRLLLERGEAGGLQAIPPTLQQSLAARLDRLGEAREVAQIGAVLGRDFTYALLAAVAAVDDRGQTALHRASEETSVSRRAIERGYSDAALQSALDRLADADLLIAEGVGPQASYRFKHALIQDAAYESLLKSRRQALHRRAAEVLRDEPERAAAQPEVIAHHFTEAALDDLAIEWWGKAGDQALRRSAFQEAIAHLGKAIAMADKAWAASTPRAAAAPASASQRLKLQTSLGRAMMYSRGFASDESQTAFARARTLAAGVGDASERFDAYYGLWIGSLARGELSVAQDTAESFLRDAESEGRMTEAAVARRCVGIARLFQGDFTDARTNLAEALRIYDPDRDRDARFRFGPDTAAVAAGYLAQASWALGDVERARELGEEALARADETAHAPTRAIVYHSVSLYHMLCGDPEAARRTAPIPVDLGREHGMALILAYGKVHSNWARARLGDRGSGITGLGEALAAYVGQGNRLYAPLFQGRLAELEAEGQDPDGPLRRIDEALALANETAEHWTDALLHRIRGAILLKRDPANPAPAEEAFRAAIAIAQAQKARSLELQAALALAKVYHSTGRPADAHDTLAQALEAFAPLPSPSGRRVGDEGYRPDDEDPRTLTPDPSPVLRPAQHEGERGDALAAEMPELAEAEALLAALAEDERVRGALEKRQARAKMHLDYARAMQWAKGWGAEEARAAIERANEFSPPTPRHADYWSLAYGRFAVSLLRGEFRAALELAEAYLRQAEVEGRPDHAVNARRLLGTVKLETGAFSESRQEFEKLLADWDEDRDKGLGAAMGADVLCVGCAYMGQLLMNLGEVDDAVSMSEGAIRRAESLGDFGSLAFALGLSLFVLAMRGRIEATLSRAEALKAAASEKGARLWESIAREWASWARGLITGDAAGAASELRDVMAARRERQERQSAYMGQGLLAQLQGRAGALDEALASIAEGLALAEQTGGHRADSFFHRIRGDILAARDPAVAEAAYHEALRIAQSQGARTFEFQAAHALAKLLSAAARPAQAHAVLAPTLEGFAPTPEMPEIAEAQALLAALAESDEVKAEAASRQRRLQLQTRYGQAMMYSRGFASDESKVAFARARTLAAGAGDASERFDAYYGLFVGSVLRGELSLARETAESFLREAENAGRMTEAAAARRNVGQARLWQGDFVGARTNLAEALRTYDAERDRDAKFRFGPDTGSGAAGFLALASWALGDVERARALSEEASARADETAHAPTRANVYDMISRFHTLRGDPETVMRTAKIPLDLGREHGMAFWLALGEMQLNWARAWLGDRESGMTGLREALAAYLGQGNKVFVPLFQGLLAELEAEGDDADGALRRIDEALALANETGEHWTDALLQRIRGAILLKRDPANPAPAEEAFRAAIAVAQAQKARSFELQAALALAKLYQSTGRSAHAHDTLAQALGGFAPLPSPSGRRVGDEGSAPNDEGPRTLTPDPSPASERGDALAAEMPELAEAQALLATLAETDEVKSAAASRQRRLQLQTRYGQAIMYSRGFGSDESKTAFARARTLAAGVGGVSERFDAYYGLFVGSLTRGELSLARETAENFLREAENEERMTEAAVARRNVGAARLCQGDFIGADANLAEALRIYDPERDRDAKFRFGADTGALAAAYRTLAIWASGDVERARALGEEALARAGETAHAPTRALVYDTISRYHMLRGDPETVRRMAKVLVDLGREHGMALYLTAGEEYSNWARAWLGECESGMTGLREALAALLG
jgi:class 3 adenylate cyclase/predicted ATPase